MAPVVDPQAAYSWALWERTQALCKLAYLDPRAHAEIALRAFDGCGEGTTEQITANIRAFTAKVRELIARASN